MTLHQKRTGRSLAAQSSDQIGSLGIRGEQLRLDAAVAQDAGDPLEARALVAGWVAGVEADQPPHELGGPVVERSVRVHRHENRDPPVTFSGGTTHRTAALPSRFVEGVREAGGVEEPRLAIGARVAT